MNDKDSFRRAYVYAPHLLSNMARGEVEVRNKLKQISDVDLVERVIESLKDQSLVDDTEFAKQWVNNRTSSKPRSAWSNRRDFTSQAVNSTLAEAVTRDVNDGESAYRAAVGPTNKLGCVKLPTFRRKLLVQIKRRSFNTSVSNLILTVFGKKSVQKIKPEFAIPLPYPTNV